MHLSGKPSLTTICNIYFIKSKTNHLYTSPNNFGQYREITLNPFQYEFVSARKFM